MPERAAAIAAGGAIGTRPDARGTGFEAHAHGTPSASENSAAAVAVFDDVPSSFWATEPDSPMPHWVAYDLGPGNARSAQSLIVKPFRNGWGAYVRTFVVQGSNADSPNPSAFGYDVNVDFLRYGNTSASLDDGAPVFDSIVDSYAYGGMWATAPYDPFPHWAAYDVGEGNEIPCNQLKLAPFANGWGSYVKDFVLQGSSWDGANPPEAAWSDILPAQAPNFTPPSNPYFIFDFPTTAPYRHYRIFVTSNYRAYVGYTDAGIWEVDLLYNEANPPIGNDTDWTNIFEGVADDTDEFTTFDFPNAAAYRHYRLKITDNYRYPYSDSAIMEMELYELESVAAPEVRVPFLHPARIQAWPNPSSSAIVIALDLSFRADVDLCVYGTDGRLIRQLLTASERDGAFRLEWDGRDDAGRRAAPGVYFCELRSGSVIVASKKPVVVR